jgi:hypothetical protein
MSRAPLAQLEERIRHDAPHLPPTDVAFLAELVARLVVAYEPERVFLFGSKARGDWGPDSDFDLLIVVPDNALPERTNSRLAYEAMWEIGRGADVIIWKKSDFDRRAHVVCSLPATVLREGKILHAA